MRDRSGLKPVRNLPVSDSASGALKPLRRERALAGADDAADADAVRAVVKADRHRRQPALPQCPALTGTTRPGRKPTKSSPKSSRNPKRQVKQPMSVSRGAGRGDAMAVAMRIEARSPASTSP